MLRGWGSTGLGGCGRWLGAAGNVSGPLDYDADAAAESPPALRLRQSGTQTQAVRHSDSCSQTLTLMQSGTQTRAVRHSDSGTQALTLRHSDSCSQALRLRQSGTHTQALRLVQSGPQTHAVRHSDSCSQALRLMQSRHSLRLQAPLDYIFGFKSQRSLD